MIVEMAAPRHILSPWATAGVVDLTLPRVAIDLSANPADGGEAGSGGGEGSSAPPPAHATVTPIDGALTLPDAATIFVNLTGPVAQIAFPAITGDRRIVVYLRQDASGGHAVAGWPAALEWADRQAPALTLAPLGRDCLIFEIVDGGALILGNVVGLGYGPAV